MVLLNFYFIESLPNAFILIVLACQL